MKRFLIVAGLVFITTSLSSFKAETNPSNCKEYAMDAVTAEYEAGFGTNSDFYDSLDTYFTYLGYCESSPGIPAAPAVLD